MRLRSVVVALATAALLCGVLWRAARTPDDAPPPAEDTPSAPPPDVTRADTRVSLPPAVTPATVFGSVVRGDDETPDIGRDVELLRDDRVVAHATTDGAGRFSLTVSTPGEPYEVRVAAEGCATVRVPRLLLLPGEHRWIGTIVLDVPRVVPVTVTDETGKPVPGAVVDVYREPRDRLSLYESSRALPPPTPIASVAVDARGECELHLPYRTLHTVIAHAPGYAQADAPLAETLLIDGDDRLRLVLPPAHALRGTVVDQAGAAVPGALVAARLRPRVWGYHGDLAESAALWQTTHADETGAFAFDGLPPGTIDVCGARPGDLPGFDTPVRLPAIDEVRLVLGATGTLGGHAKQHGGGPLAGVVVGYRVGVFAGTTVTGADGAYHVDGLPAGTMLDVDLVAPDGWLGPLEPGVARGIAGVPAGDIQEWLHAGEHLVIDATFRRVASVAGTVRMDGAPAAAAWVRVYTLADAPFRSGMTSTRSGPDGRYVVDDAMPGRVVALAAPASVPSNDLYSVFEDLWKARFGTEEARDAAAVPVVVGSVAQLDVEAALPDGFEPIRERMERMDEELSAQANTRRVHVSGRVTTSDGLPLRNVRVAAASGMASHPVDVSDDFVPWQCLPVEADGRFDGTTEAYASDGAVVIHVSAKDDRHGAVARDLALRADGDLEVADIELELPPLPVLRGIVTCDGQPVPAAEIRLNGATVARTDADGAFEIGLPAGEHYVTARAEGFVESGTYGVSPPDQKFVEMEVVPARTLSGTVVDAHGQPVPGVLVCPMSENGDEMPGYDGWWESGKVPLTDADGRFRVPDLPRTPVLLEVLPPDRGTALTGRITVGPFGPDDDDVQIVAPAPRRLSGRVTFPEGVKQSRVTLRFLATDEGRAAGAGERKVMTAYDGTFAVRDLLAVPYEVSILPPRSSKLQPALVEVAADQEELQVTLQRGAVISGIARWADGSPFLPDLQLRPLDSIPAGVTDWDLTIDVERDGTFSAYVCSGVRYAIGLRRDDWADAVTLAGGESVLAGTTGVVITATRVVDGVDPAHRNAGTVAGRILTMGGDPVAGAEVLVVPAEGDTLRATSDAEGRYSVSGLHPGANAKATVVVYAQGLATTQVDDVKIGATNVRIALAWERTISGRLLTADGAPARGWRIRALRAKDPAHDLWRADPDADGNFVLTGLSRGMWNLEAIVERNDGIHDIVPLRTVHGGAKDLELHLP